ncbi:glycoside hydrolase family 88 protein [Allosalinactinospora lopnorensis]|uniref:glycoside hydrolase family 88 protein n=1 Tax=Allosalinactinospora lopnorensis TaxID=1352348 RepID=UPI0009E3E5C8|nr:glycoside hydrolase family 88 protein [Allosalinactinospora lopnorensis]
MSELALDRGRAADRAGSGVFGAAYSTARHQVRRLVNEYPRAFPTFTSSGRWDFEEDPWAPTWSAGFLTGMLWMFSDSDGTGWWRERAEEYSGLLEPRKHDTGTHDIGFLFTPSWGRWHQRFPDDRTRDVLITAGRTMAQRYNPRGRYLSTWVAPGSTFIDVMMNIEVIFQAAQLSGDAELADIAHAHARTSRRFLVRGDGTSVHEGWFDPDTGVFERTATHQGYRADSSWVRGHSWAIYGFTDAFVWTGDPDMLDTARLLADTYIDRTGDALVPPNDWEDPQPPLPHESSAGAIAAAALLRLGDADPANTERYRRYALRLLAALCGPEFLASPGSGWEGVLKHGTYHYNNGVGVDESVMWGDHYFVEALHHVIHGGRQR